MNGEIITTHEYEKLVLKFINFKNKNKDNFYIDSLKLTVNSRSKKNKIRHFLKLNNLDQYSDDIIIVKTQVKSIEL